MKRLEYVANQITPEGLDEIQRILLAKHFKQHVALSGPPGVGKTQSVELLPALTGQELFDITGDERLSESALLGFPELQEQNGATITTWKNGVVTQAAEQGGIFYGDEYDLIQGSTQKRMNSLLDGRRTLRRRDGKLIEAHPDFFAIISYNPSDSFARRDLEDSVADRYVHIDFSYLPTELEATLAARGSLDGLVERGVSFTKTGPVFSEKTNGTWYGLGAEEVSQPEFIYPIFTGGVPEFIAPRDVKEDKESLANSMAELTGVIRQFAETGTANIPATVRSYLANAGEQTQVRLHKPSVRILQASLDQYQFLVEQGLDQAKAQAYAVNLSLDQMAYGKYGNKSVGSITLKTCLQNFAKHYELIGEGRQAVI